VQGVHYRACHPMLHGKLLVLPGAFGYLFLLLMLHGAAYDDMAMTRRRSWSVYNSCGLTPSHTGGRINI